MPFLRRPLGLKNISTKFRLSKREPHWQSSEFLTTSWWLKREDTHGLRPTNHFVCVRSVPTRYSLGDIWDEKMQPGFSVRGRFFCRNVILGVWIVEIRFMPLWGPWAFWAPGVNGGGQMGVKTAKSPKTDYLRLKICVDRFFHAKNPMEAFIFTIFKNLTLFGAP